jgi:hypothetical protein
VADEAAGDREEGLVDVGSSFVAQSQSAVLVQPGEAAFDDPALAAESGAVFVLLAGDLGVDSACVQSIEHVLGVVAAVAEHALWPLSWAAWFALDAGDRVEQVEQLAGVGPVGGGEDRGERDPVPVADQVVFAAGFAPVYGARAGFGAPFNADTNEESTTARDQSILSASCSFASSVSCRRCQTPCSCHSCSRRQQVMPEPQPSSCGRCSQAIPVFKTNRIPVSTRRSSIRFRPGYRRRRTTSGISGFTIAHSSSHTSSRAIVSTLSHEVDDNAFASADEDPSFR